MKKRIKRRYPSAPQGPEPDMSDPINKILEKMAFLERKIDTLINRSSESPSEPRHFSKPFQRFDQPHHQGDRRPSSDYRERTLHKAVCADCGKECEVPFKPSGDRPVYCKECFGKRKGAGPFKERHTNRPAEHAHAKAHHFDKREGSEIRKFGEKKKVGFKKRKRVSLAVLLALGLALNCQTMWATDDGMDKAVDKLNEADNRNQELLSQVIDASNESAGSDSNVTFDNSQTEESSQTSDKGGVKFSGGGKQQSLSGTGGVALLEHNKDSIQTTTSNISGVGSSERSSKKNAERKIAGQ